jgi:hypothetical protein
MSMPFANGSRQSLFISRFPLLRKLPVRKISRKAARNACFFTPLFYKSPKKQAFRAGIYIAKFQVVFRAPAQIDLED